MRLEWTNFDKNMKFPQANIGKISLAIIALFLLSWLSTGIYKVRADQSAVVLQLGNFSHISGSGLHYNIPHPIGRVIKKNTANINKEIFLSDLGKHNDIDPNNVSKKIKVGYLEKLRLKSDYIKPSSGGGIMLTGDENVVDIDFVVHWRIDNVKNAVLKVEDLNGTVRRVSESVIREVIARRPISDALSDKKSEIGIEAKSAIQEVLNEYETGVEIMLVQLLRTDPPQEVINSFRDIQTARADKESLINEAEAYRNSIIPKARGGASKLLEESYAYKDRKIAEAEGQSKRFEAIYKQYNNNRSLTRKRMHIEMFEEVFGKAKLILVEDKVGQILLPYSIIGNEVSRNDAK